MIQTKTIAYSSGTIDFHGFLAQKLTDTPSSRPGVLVAHAWGGRDSFAENKARLLAEMGYTALAIDLYGKGAKGSNPEENAALMKPLMENRNELQSRMALGLETIKQIPGVDASRIAAIGFCFGGLAVLDLARTGANFRGAVSFHGLLTPPDNIPKPAIRAAILALHGYDDPMATPEQLAGFADELTMAGADWQIHAYGGTVHAFTNPEAHNPDFGTVYNERAATRAWESMQRFLDEVLK